MLQLDQATQGRGVVMMVLSKHKQDQAKRRERCGLNSLKIQIRSKEQAKGGACMAHAKHLLPC